jgi:hypothetical protein
MLEKDGSFLLHSAMMENKAHHGRRDEFKKNFSNGIMM